MKKEHFLLFVVALMILVAIVLRIKQPYQLNKAQLGQVSRDDSKISIAEINNIDVQNNNSEIVNEVLKAEVFIPLTDSLVSSPLEIKGRAPGSWFFEASLPVKLVDTAGNVIVQHYAQAQTDWMTSDYVPFISTLTFSTEASNGFLIIAKDNPSGLSEYDEEIKIPVIFKLYE